MNRKERVDKYWNNFFAASMARDSGIVFSSKGKHLANGGVIIVERAHQKPLILTSKESLDAGQVCESRLMKLFGEVMPTQDTLKKNFSVVEDMQFYYQFSKSEDENTNNFDLLLGTNNCNQINEFKSNFSEDEWDFAGPNLGEGPSMAIFEEDKITAMAGFVFWRYEDNSLNHCICDLANVTVITHPKYRGKGRAPQIVKALNDFAIQFGVVPQYKVDSSNLSSLRVAQKLNMEFYARHYYLKPKP